MAEEHPSDDKHIEEILTDLDTILSDLTQTDARAAEMVQMPAPPQMPGVVSPPPPPKPAPVPPPKQPAPASPPKPAAAPPAIKPVPAPAPVPQKIPYAKPQPGSVPAATPAVPSPAAKPPAPPPAAPAKAADLKIELAPREGTLPPVKKTELPPPKKPAGLPPTHPPMEISPAQTPAAPPVAAPAPAPAPVLAPAPVAAAKPAPVEAVASGDEVPDGTPHEYVRRVVAIFNPKYAPNIPQFFAFLQQSAQTVSKKPLFLRRVLSEAVDANTDLPSLIGRAEGFHAVAALAVVEGLPDDKAKQLEETFKRAKIDYRQVAPDDLLKRSVAVDILVEIMLLPSEL